MRGHKVEVRAPVGAGRSGQVAQRKDHRRDAYPVVEGKGGNIVAQALHLFALAGHDGPAADVDAARPRLGLA